MLTPAYPNTAHSNDTLKYVHEKMVSPERERFVRLILEALDALPSKRLLWLTVPEDLSHCRDATAGSWDATALLHRVGVPSRGKDRHWLVLLRFRADSFEILYRPTSLDLGSQYFVPSPDSWQADAGGCCVGIPAPSAGIWAREFVGLPRSHGASMHDSDRDCVQVQRESHDDDVMRSRVAHVALLAAKLGALGRDGAWVSQVASALDAS